MNEAIRAMMDRRKPASQADWDRALREVLQEAALAGLWRSGFFEKAAFYGGTALRLFHHLDRFSEDLDFTLMRSDPDWKLSDFLLGLRRELEAFGFSATIEPKHQGPVESAFIKANTRVSMISIKAPAGLTDTIAPNRLLKVKLEIDTDPPSGIRTENRTLLQPFPASIRIVEPACLFAGKMHACLCRAWKTRVKGRDWYDLLFFVSHGVPLDVEHLDARMRQSGHWIEGRPLEAADIQGFLAERIHGIDWNQAREDVLPFISDPRALELWGPGLFSEAVKTLRVRSGH